MEDPAPAPAPVIPPEMIPTVQVKVLGMEAVRLMFDDEPLHMPIAAELVTTGAGLTVTMMVRGIPTQEVATEVGVTIY